MKSGVLSGIAGISSAGILGAILAFALVAAPASWASEVDNEPTERNREEQGAQMVGPDDGSALSKVEVELSESRTRAEVDRTVQEWRLKIDRFTQSAADTTAAGFERTKAKLDSAWDGVEREWANLKAATRDEWNGAQSSFDDAVEELKRVWQEVAG